MSFQVGDTLGDYEIVGVLGAGGMGRVYKVRNVLSDRLEAMKVLLPGLVEAPDQAERFLREIRVQASLEHPNIAALRTALRIENQLVMILELVEGTTLQALLERGPLPLNEAIGYMSQALAALAYAHERGVVHRDIKPGNIMLTRAGIVKLTDFGIAKAVRDRKLTATGATLGSLYYMSPEQVKGDTALDARSDLYSLGVTLYEAVAGLRPFQGDSDYAILSAHLNEAPAPPMARNPGIPPELNRIILRSLAKEPPDRFQSAAEFREALQRVPGLSEGVAAAKTQAIFEVPALGGSGPVPVSPAGTARLVSSPPSPSGTLEMAYVLFMDLVGYSTLPMDRQSARIQQLQQIVRTTPEFRRAQESNQLIPLPTGDGMALVFFQNPVAPVQCATEIARALRSYPELKLRMGIHTGPVYRIADINTNLNVAGGGINLAQRVMDCGDGGHILVSKSVAEVLSQLSDWAGHLHELGEYEVKHGVKVPLVNLYTGEVGNAELPQKLRQTTALPPPVRSARSRRGVYALAGVLLVIGIVVGGMQLSPWRKTKEDRSPAPPAGLSSPSPASPPAAPSPPSSTTSGLPPAGLTPSPPTLPPQTPPPQTLPSSSPQPQPTPPPQTLPSSPPQPQETVEPGRPGLLRQRRFPGFAGRGSSEPSNVPQPPQPPSSASVPAPQETPGSADRTMLQELRERMIRLGGRARAVFSSLESRGPQQRRAVPAQRAEIAAARQSFAHSMEEAKASLAAGDATAAKSNLDLAEANLEKLEGFLRQ